MTVYTAFRRVMIAFSLGLVSLPGFCQLSIGLEGGYIRNQLLTNNANQVVTNYRSATGFTLGIPVVYRLSSSFALVTAPAFIQKNYRFERSGGYTGLYENVTNTYFQLPLMGRFMVGTGKISAFASAGVFGAYWAASHLKGAIPDDRMPIVNPTRFVTYGDVYQSYTFDEGYTFDNRQDNRFEAGWIGGLGVGYQFTDQFQLVAEGRYLYSFTPQQKSYANNSVCSYNDALSLTLGLMIKLAR